MMFSTANYDNVIEATLGAPCHGDMVYQTETPQTSDTPTSGPDDNCCDDGCSMIACHSVSVLLSSVDLIDLEVQNHSAFILSQAAVIKPATSLYRPPILG